MPNSMRHVSVHVEPERIAFVKFILEGYDGLAVLSTNTAPDYQNITLRFHPASCAELLAVLDSLQINTQQADISDAIKSSELPVNTP